MPKFIRERHNIAPVAGDTVIDFVPVPGWDVTGPYVVTLEYYTEVADPTSSEGWSILFEWIDTNGVPQSYGGVPISLAIATPSARQSPPAQLVNIQYLVDAPHVSGYDIKATISVSNFNPVIGVGTSKIGYQISWQHFHDTQEYIS